MGGFLLFFLSNYLFSNLGKGNANSLIRYKTKSCNRIYLNVIHATMHRAAEEQQIILMKNKSNYLKRYILMVICVVLKHIMVINMY